MTIQNNTARKLMYEWHSGQTSPFYAAASSGLCADYGALEWEANKIDDPSDRAKLLAWITKRKTAKKKIKVIFMGQSYFVLPWVHRSYIN